MTLIIGRNNTGKSSLLRAICTIQNGFPVTEQDVRIGAPNIVITATPADTLQPRMRRLLNRDLPSAQDLVFRATFYGGGLGSATLSWKEGGGTGIPIFSASRQESVIAPVLARRKSERYEEAVSRRVGDYVGVSDRDLTSRISALSNGDHAEGQRYRKLRDKVLEVPISVFLTENGQQPGLALSPDMGIGLDRMGEGVSSALKLITELASDRPRLYVIEEPENDLHPGALRELLEAIVEGLESGSQFLISTHSDQVLRHLGSVEAARVFQASLDRDTAGVPLTTYSPIEGSFARREVLRDLGYEGTTPLGWLVLEESSMETFLTRYIVPEFAPRLSSLRSISARGAGNVPRSVEDLHRFALYAHLGDQRDRLWVLVDGDEAGLSAIRTLTNRYSQWPSDRFFAMRAPNLESLYPDRFAPEVDTIRGLPDRRQRSEAKHLLLKEVLVWCGEYPDDARKHFAKTAEDLIGWLAIIQTAIDSLDVIV